MGEPLVAEPTTTDPTPLSTNSVAFQNSSTAKSEIFGIEDLYRALIFFCDKYQLDKKQVALGLFLSVLLIIFSVGTVIAWNRYSPIIQEFIIKENIEKAKTKNQEKNSEKRRMKRFKNFLNKTKTQAHFRNSGQGVRLGEASSSSAASSDPADRAARADAVANAALRRLEKSAPETPQDAAKRRIQMKAKAELEKERKELEELNLSSSRPPEPEREKELDHSSAISHVLYTSELLGEDHVASKSDLMKDIETFLKEQIGVSDDEGDRVTAAVLMLYSLNKQAVKEGAIQTISKIVQNILDNPGVEKFRSIRKGTNVFQNVIGPAIGAVEFLLAVGFVEKQEGDQTFLTFTRTSDAHFVEALEALREGQSVPIKVARNLELFIIKEGQTLKSPQLGNEFYNLSASEVKAEQKAKEAQVERMLTLRTKEMRQKDEQLTNYRYRYTLIRVRFPGNILMQGVFGCHEPFSAVRLFVASVLSPHAITSEFSLRDAVGQLVEDESASLAQLSLAPAALLHLVFAQPLEDEHSIVADEYIDKIRPLE